MARVPTLTSAGWVADPVNMATTLLDYFLASEHSQSQIYLGKVSSLPRLVQQYGHAPLELEDTVQQQLYDYLAAYFDGARVRVDAENIDEGETRYNLRIDAMVIKNGIEHSLGRLIQIGESRILDAQESY